MLKKIESKEEIESIIMNDVGTLYLRLKGFGVLKVNATSKGEKELIRLKIGQNSLFINMDQVEELEKLNSSYFLTLEHDKRRI